MKYFVTHYKDGYQVLEQDGEREILIASFHREPGTRVGTKSLAQRRAEEYCDMLNQINPDDGLTFNLNDV